MLKELRLINWKSFRDATLYIDPLTIIIGMNAGGKSNVLDALLFLQRLAAGTPISTAIAGDAEIPGLRGGLEWVTRKPEKKFTLEVLVTSKDEERTDYRYSITIAVNGTRAELAAESLIRLKYRPRSDTPSELNLFITKSEEATTAAIPAYFYTATRGPGKRLDLNRTYSILTQVDSLTVRKEITQAARSVIDQLKRVFILDPIPSHMRNYQPLSEKLQTDAANIAGVLSALPDERKTEVEATLTDYLRKLPERDIGRVWTEPVGKFKTDAMLYCEEAWATNEEPTIVDLRGMSDGTLRFLAIVVALLTLEEGSLLVVEEVDNGLHPSRAQVLVNMLREQGKKRRIDVIVTTHNPAMLDALGSRMVPFVTVAHRDGKTGESRLTLLEEIEQLPKLLASGSIGRLSTQGKIEAALHSEEEEGGQ
jgi:predicted ATPase